MHDPFEVAVVMLGCVVIFGVVVGKIGNYFARKYPNSFWTR
jgi:hypothetical protein